MPFAPFEGPKLKIERARQFQSEIYSLREAFRSSKPFKVVEAEDGPTQRRLLVHWDAVDKQVGLVLGDAIHNVRSALDIMACDIARLNGATEVSDVTFPISKNKKGFDDTIQSHRILKLGTTAIDLLVQIKPFDGGNPLLYELNQLDNAHKHRLPLLTAARFEFRVPQERWRKPDPRLIEDQTNSAADFAFEEGGPFGGRVVIPVLEEAINAASDIVARFETVLMK